MTNIVNFNSKIFQAAERERLAADLVQEMARDFRDLTKRRMFPDGHQTGAEARRRDGSRFKRSRRGERPAKDSGALIEGIEDRQLSEFSVEVVSTATRDGFDYPEHLQKDLERLIITDADREEAQAELTRRAEAAVKGLL
jgi:hypothetical protein